MSNKESIDFIGIGAARCGSSWIGNVLRMHPDVCISEPKEIRYFNRYQMPIGKDKGKLNSNYDQEIDWYFKRFSHARSGQVKGEISPVYFIDEAAAPAIKKAFPDIKLILCLRNPVKRAYSSYRLHSGLGMIDDMPFEQALEQESMYVDMGLYAKQLKRYYEHFDSQKILVVIFEKLIKNPEKEFIRIFEFLGVTKDLDFDFSKRHTNESSTMRSKLLHKYAFKFTQLLINARMGYVVHALRKLGAHSLMNKVNSASSKCESMSVSTEQKLTKSFLEDIRELETLLGIDLDEWIGEI